MPGNKTNVSTPTVDWGVLLASRLVVEGDGTCSARGGTEHRRDAGGGCLLAFSAQQTLSSRPAYPLQYAFNGTTSAFNCCFQSLLARIWMGQGEHTETQIVSAVLDFNLEAQQPFPSINREIFLQAACCNFALYFCVLWKSFFF